VQINKSFQWTNVSDEWILPSKKAIKKYRKKKNMYLHLFFFVV